MRTVWRSYWPGLSSSVLIGVVPPPLQPAISAVISRAATRGRAGDRSVMGTLLARDAGSANATQSSTWPRRAGAGPAPGPGSVELVARIGRGLLDPHPPDLDVGARVVLAFHLVARQPAQHRQLAGVGEGVGDATLEHARRLPADRRPRGEVGVERPERGVEARDLLRPGLRR